MKNYYAMLQVPAGCSTEEIRQSYRRLVQEHLDDAVVFAELREAYEVLSSPARRAEYDKTLWGADAAAPLGVSAGADPEAGRRCPMGAEGQCPVLSGRLALTETYCAECGYALEGLKSGASFETEAPTAASGRAWLEDESGKMHPLRLGVNSVGRENGDVLVSDKTVSRNHAHLMLGEDSMLMVEDLGSTNGTRVGEETLSPQAARSLTNGDRVRFGSVSFTVHLPAEMASAGAAAPNTLDAAPNTLDAAPNTLGAAPTGTARAQMVDLREGAGRVFPLLPGLTTFGRRPENSVVITGDLYVSGSHAQISADGTVFILTDVGSTNGTLLNGERIPINTPFTLDSGDEVLVGGTALRFERLAEALGETLPETALPEETLLEKALPEEETSASAEEMLEVNTVSAEVNTVSAEVNAEDAPEHSEGQL